MDISAGSELTPITSPDQLPAGDEGLGVQTFGKLLEEIAELISQAGGSSILPPEDIELMLNAKKSTVTVGTALEIYTRIKKLKERFRTEKVPPPPPPPTPVVVVDEEPRRGSLLSAVVVGVVAACAGVAIGFFLGKAPSQRKRRQHRRRRAPRSDGLASISPSPSQPPTPSILHRLFPSNPPVGPGGGGGN